MTNTGSTPRNRPDVVPLSHAGKWIAWTPDDLHIAGVGDTMDEAVAAAKAAGVDRARLEWVPRRRKEVTPEHIEAVRKARGEASQEKED